MSKRSQLLRPEILGIITVVVITGLLSLSATSRVLADDVPDDVVTSLGSGTYSVILGQVIGQQPGTPLAATLWINANGECNADDGNPAIVIINSQFVSPTNQFVLTHCGLGGITDTAYFTIPANTAPGLYPVTATASSFTSSGVYNTAGVHFNINVLRPQHELRFTTVPAPITVTATSSAGAVVTYNNPTAVIFDPVTGTESSETVTVSCNPPSGSTFPVGQTTVICTPSSTDPDIPGGIGPGIVFIVTVNPQANTAPTLQLPQNMIVEASSASGAAVAYSATATDTEDGSIPVTCTPHSDTTFPIGLSTVNCSATDSGGLETTGSFTVTVADTKAPANVIITSAVDKHLRPVSNGATVPSKSITFQLSTPTDVGGIIKGCSLDGGTPTSCTGTVSYSALRPGSHTFVYIARDAAGNTASDRFSWIIPLDAQ